MTQDITNVDLRFLRKARGIAPLSRYALTDDGSVTVAVPDSMEVRTLHFARFDSGGRSRVEETYSVETLRKTEIAPTGGGIGITGDDLYLFRESRKSRFLADRRASFADVALNATGQRFAAAFTDMLAADHALAWGDIGGRALWTKDIAFPIARVGVDRPGAFIAVAGETGDLQLFDSARNLIVRFQHETPLRAIATIGPSRTVFAASGGAGAVDHDGHLIWFAELEGEPIEIALDGEGRTTAILLRLDDTSGRLVLLSTDGLPSWEIDLDESRPTGLSLSANGRWAAISLRDGSLCVYELHYGERFSERFGDGSLDEARAAREAGNYAAALHLLRAQVAARPDDVAAGDAYRETLQEQRARSLAAADAAIALGDWAAADACLVEVVDENPFDAEAVRKRTDLRHQWANAARTAGGASLESGEVGVAEAHFLEAIEADPLDRDARLGLADARRQAADRALERGQTLIAGGEFAAAIAVLAEVQAHGAAGAKPAIAGLLREARIGEALALGNTLYQDRQYAAALFQYKKALRLDPENADARQKVAYSSNFLQDTQLNDRFTRLE